MEYRTVMGQVLFGRGGCKVNKGTIPVPVSLENFCCLHWSLESDF
jgi:hypothetical protein